MLVSAELPSWSADPRRQESRSRRVRVSHRSRCSLLLELFVKATDARIPPAPKMHPFATVELFGLPFVDAPDEASVAEHMLGHTRATLTEGVHPIVVTPNVDIVVQLERAKTRGLRERMADCAYVLPDGAPIVWSSKWAGTPLEARIAGSNLFRHWWPQVAAESRKVVVFCSSEAVRVGLAADHPDATIVVAPMIDTSDEQVGVVAADLVTEALAAEADYCVVCIGHPKDAMIALAAIDQWPVDQPAPLILCLGASAELYLGLKRRAPEWAQRYGLEWLVRFAQEPRRMFHRYFVRDLGFFPMALREVTARRRS